MEHKAGQPAQTEGGLDNLETLFTTPTVLLLSVILWSAQWLKAATAGQRVPGSERRKLSLFNFQILNKLSNTLQKNTGWNADNIFLNKIAHEEASGFY